MSVPGSSSIPAWDPTQRDGEGWLHAEKVAECKRAVAALEHCIAHDIKPRDIMTFKAFENAVRLVMVTGGSTNATIHLIAMARAAGVDFTLEDFRRISAETPFIANLKPSGKYVMEDLHKARALPLKHSQEAPCMLLPPPPPPPPPPPSKPQAVPTPASSCRRAP